MKIRIYHINLDRDDHRVAFQSFDELKTLQGYPDVDSTIYDRVFEGDVECDDLEDVYRMFNLDVPEGYRGRLLSVSDVVETVDKNGKSTFAFCDNIGFVEVDFDPNLTEEVKNNI